MLAERKKKVKWTLNPRGNAWSKDTNKFGQRMLEKMGWKSGEGLGVNKQGISEHIKVAYKNDNKCLGYKDNGEEWVEHQSQFESLLAELTSSHSAAATLESVKNVSQNETLEERSRHSRTRVHYQKFSRGKDLSKYSEKDLKCIILCKQKANSADEENEDNGGNEYSNSFYGIKTINSGSMNDYFEKLTNSQNYSDTYSSAVEFGEVDVSEKNNDVGEHYDLKVKKKKKRKTEDTYSSAVQFGEVETIERNNVVGEQCDVKVKKKKKRKADLQVSDTENCSMDSNEASAIKQHENKRKKWEVLEHSNSANDYLYTDYKNRSVSESELQRQDITDLEGILINSICNEELQCNEICKEERPKRQRDCDIQDRESELMEVDDEIEGKQVKTKLKKKNSELVNEGNESSLVPADVLSKSENSKPFVEHLTFEVGDEKEVTQAKKKSKKKRLVSSSGEETSLVPVESVSYNSKNAEHTRLHLTAELDEIEGKQKNKKCKKKKREFTGDCGETSVSAAEEVSHRLENSKDPEEHLSVEDKQLNKKSKKKTNDLLSEGGEISILPTEDVSCRLENSKDTEQHFAVEVAVEIGGKQLKKKSKKKKDELLSKIGETSVLTAEYVLYRLENTKDTKQHLAVEATDEIGGEQLKKKSKKKRDDLLSKSGEISIFPAEDASCMLESAKDPEQYLALEVTDEIGGKQLKRKSKRKRHTFLSEGGGTSFVPVEDVSQKFEVSENIAEHLISKDEEKLTESTLGVDTFCENKHRVADINRFGKGASSDEVRSNEQTAEDVIPTKRKKKKNTKLDSEKTVVEDILKYVNDISVEKRQYKTKKDENEINGQSEQAESVMKEDKKINADEKLQNVANSMHSSLQSIANENIAEKLNKGCLESLAKFHERYSVDEIKNMKSSLFAQLVDPRLIEFKGSNLHKIAGYGKS